MLFARLEVQTGAVHAVTQAIDAGAIGKDMAQMPVTFGAAHFGADHAVTGVANFLDRVDVDGRCEAGPARSAIIFFLAIEQFRAAAGAIIDAIDLVGVELAGEGPFGAAFAQHMKLFGAQALAPFGIGEAHLLHGRNMAMGSGRIKPAPALPAARWPADGRLGPVLPDPRRTAGADQQQPRSRPARTLRGQE